MNHLRHSLAILFFVFCFRYLCAQNCQPPYTIPTPSYKKEICYFATTGDTINANPSNNPHYTYLWSNHSTSSAIVSGAGSFSVTITDTQNNCNAVFSDSIVHEPEIYFSPNQTLFCSDSASANYTVIASGGDSIFTYILPGIDTNTTGYFPNQPGGNTFDVIIIDGLGCSLTFVDYIPNIVNPGFLITTDSGTCSDSIGFIEIHVSDINNQLFYYSLDSGKFQDGGFGSYIFNDVSPGIHSVAVKNSGVGCIYHLTAVVPPAPVPNISKPIYKPTVCYGAANDTINANPLENSSRNFAWSTGDTNSYIVIGSGIYFVTVTNTQNNCSAVFSNSIGQYPQIGFSDLTQYFACEDTAANVMLLGRGGSGMFTYTLVNVGTDTTGHFIGVPSGSYQFIITDNTGCSISDSITIPESIANDSFSIQTVAITCSEAKDGKVIVTPIESSIYPWLYSVDSSSFQYDDSVLIGLSPGLHYVIIESAVFACYFVYTAIVDSSVQACGSNFIPCSAHFILYPDSTMPHHWYALSQATGTGPLTYFWQWGDGDTSSGPAPSHIYADSGHYTICLTIIDSIGCVSKYCDADAYLRSTEGLMIYVNVVTELPTGISQLGNANPSVSIYPNPATNQLIIEPINFAPRWISVYDMNGQKISEQKFTRQLDISALAAGLYFIEVKNENTVERKKFVKM